MIKLPVFRALMALIFSVEVSSALAADVPALTALFSSLFPQIWVENQCHDNTVALVRAAVKQGIDLERSYIVTLKDPYYSAFGMVEAFRAREGGAYILPKRTEPPFLQPGLDRWFHHVFLVAHGKADPKGNSDFHVFDLSFENSPTVLEFEDYLDRMYIPTEKPVTLAERKKITEHFEIEFFDPKKYLNYLDRKNTYQEALVREGILIELYPDYFKKIEVDCNGILGTDA